MTHFYNHYCKNDPAVAAVSDSFRCKNLPGSGLKRNTMPKNRARAPRYTRALVSNVRTTLIIAHCSFADDQRNK